MPSCLQDLERTTPRDGRDGVPPQDPRRPVIYPVVVDGKDGPP